MITKCGAYVTAPRLEEEPDNSIVWQVETDRKVLSDLVGDDVVGLAYPYGMQKREDRVIEVIKQNEGIVYARTTNSTYGFDLQTEDLLFF